MAIYTHLLHSPPQTKNKLGFYLGQNGAIYTHFLHSPPQAKKIGVLGGQNGAIYTHCFFFVFVKMLPYIHILVDFLVQNATIYTHFGEFFGSKRCHIYTFLEFNFLRKNEKKKQ
jgi:hypothetical protein